MMCRDVLECDDGIRIESIFSLNKKTSIRTFAGGGHMFNGGLSDKTGSIDLVYFGGQDPAVVQELFNA